MEGLKGAVKKLGKFRTKDTHVDLLLAELQDRFDGKITQEELQSACLRWSYYYSMKDLTYKPLPTPPDRVAYAFHMKAGKRKKLLAEDSELRDMILDYGSKLIGTKSINKANKEWLHKMEKYFIEKGETDKVETIQETMNAYQR